MLMLSLACGFAVHAEEEEFVLEIDDPIYQKFQGQNISINVYNWGEYISDSSGLVDVNAAFTELTGIKVNYTLFASNEEMYAKLKSGGTSYDIVIPSDYMISRMISEDMLLPLDFANIPNVDNIMESFLHPQYDPENLYSVPYTWGTVGIIYNTAYIEDEIDSWDALWDERYMGQILMFSNPRDAFGISLTRLGYSQNTTDPDHLEDAAEALQDQKYLVQAYVMDEIFDKMGSGEAYIAPYYAGDALIMMDENPDLQFVLPKEGTNRFVDAMCIPVGSTQKEAAELYINFMCEAQIAYATTDYIGYSTPNRGAYEMLDEEIINDGISYPSDEALANTETFINLPTETNTMMQQLWTEVISVNSSTSVWVMPILVLLAVVASAGINIYRRVKKKRNQY